MHAVISLQQVTWNIQAVKLKASVINRTGRVELYRGNRIKLFCLIAGIYVFQTALMELGIHQTSSTIPQCLTFWCTEATQNWSLNGPVGMLGDFSALLLLHQVLEVHQVLQVHQGFKGKGRLHCDCFSSCYPPKTQLWLKTKYNRFVPSLCDV